MKCSNRAEKAIHLAGVEIAADTFGASLVTIAAYIAKTRTWQVMPPDTGVRGW